MARDDEVDLSVQIEAKIDKLEKQMARANAIASKSFKQMQKSADDASKNMESSMAKAASGIQTRLGGIGKSLTFGAAGLLGVQGVRDIAQFAAQYRDLQNALKVTGLEGKALQDVFRSLSRISLEQGAPLDALVTLYSRASQSAKELNASQSDLLEFSDGIATALRVAGTSATEAQGALLQLSQALGGGIVRAEEFNSVNEGARPILQAVADGLDEAGGSVSKLRSIVLDGKLSSEAFFRAFLAGASDLREQAARTSGTVSQSMSRIGTAMTLLIGHLDDTLNASTNAARNLDTVAKVIEALPGYIDAASRGLDALDKKLSDFGSSDFFVKLNQLMGVDGDAATADFLKKRAQDITLGGVVIRPGVPIPSSVTSSGPDARVAAAFDVTAGSGIVEGTAAAGKSSRVLGESADRATVSLKDFAVATDAAANASKSSFPTGGAISDYVSNVVAAESGGRANAKNPNSSATGLGQFIESTWLQLFKANFPDRAASMTNGAILALRSDAEISRQLIESYATENANVLRSAGVAVNEAALHLSHFLGAGDAVKVLSAAKGTPLAGLISPASIAANPTILGGGRTVDDARAYAERRATGTRQAAGNFTPAETEAQKRAASYQELIARSAEYIASQKVEAATIGMTAQQAAKLRYEQELLNEAKRRNIELTPDERAQLSDYAAGMAEVETATSKAEQAQENLKQTQKFLKQGVGDFFTNIITGSATVEEALQQLLATLAKAALQAGLMGDGPLAGLFGGQGGGILGALFGFADGGVAAHGKPVSLPRFARGGVSRSAAIFGEAGPEAAVPLPDGRRIPVDLSMPKLPQAGNVSNHVQNITIAPSVTVNATGGTDENNRDLAAQVSKQVETSVRAIVANELRTAMRPGGMMR